LKKEKKKNFQFQKRKKGKFYFFQKRKKKRAVFIKREKENTPDFSDNIHNIKKFVQVDLSEKITKNRLIFPVSRSRKMRVLHFYLLLTRSFRKNRS
jgi:hypothetical protein